MKIKTICALAAAALFGANLYAAGFDNEKDPFILGMYSADPQTDKVFKMLSDSGVNYVHTYYKKRSTPEERRKILDLAQKYNMKVMLDIGASNLVRTDVENYMSGVMAEVKATKDHPALGMWYLFDEPKTEQLPHVAKVRKELSKVSNIPTSLVIHWREKWENTRGYSDIWMVDTYPVRGEDFPNAPLQHCTAFVRGAARTKRPGTPFIPVLQACDFTCFPDQARKLEDKSKLRYPNLVEMRFMAYSSLTFGVRGLFFYSLYHSHLEKPAGRAWWQDVLSPLLLEVKAFTDAVPRAWEVTAHDYKIDKRYNVNLAYWARSTGNFLVLTNNTPETRSVSIDLTGTAFPETGELTPYAFTAPHKVQWNSGKLEVAELSPWETLIYRVK